MSSLFCNCGRRFFPMGVEPGHLARCPACGAWMRVPLEDAVPNDAVAQLLARNRSRRPARVEGDRLRDCLRYPLEDGPGVALLVFLPPFVWLMSVPVFDLIRFAWSGPRGTFNPFFIVVVPLATPLGISFALTFGYILLFLGGVFVASAMGESMHPSWPMWDIPAILEGLGRWLWAALMGMVTGAFPVILFWVNAGDLSPLEWVILIELLAIGVAYAQMALASSLLHDSLLAAHPAAVLRSIGRLGWDALKPSLLASTVLGLTGLAFYLALFRVPNVGASALALWASWVFGLYGAMVSLRYCGLTYHRHAERLGWCRSRPRWAIWGRQGKLYANS